MNTNGTCDFVLFSGWSSWRLAYGKNTDMCVTCMSPVAGLEHTSKLPLDPLFCRCLMYTHTLSQLTRSVQQLDRTFVVLPVASFSYGLILRYPLAPGPFCLLTSYPDHPTAGHVKEIPNHSSLTSHNIPHVLRKWSPLVPKMFWRSASPDWLWLASSLGPTSLLWWGWGLLGKALVLYPQFTIAHLCTFVSVEMRFLSHNLAQTSTLISHIVN